MDEFGKFIIVNSKFISSDGTIAKSSNKQICPLYKNDIVMVMSDVPKGKAIAKCLLIDTNNKYTLNQRICSLRAKETPFFYKFSTSLLFLGVSYQPSRMEQEGQLVLARQVSPAGFKQLVMLICSLIMPWVKI